MSPENAEYLKEIVTSCLQAYPRLGSSFTPDVEEEANSYYEKIYKGEMSIPQVVELLRRYRDSTIQREQDIYNFFTQVLFDEYKFFPRYPDKELNVTSILFGALIQNVFVQATTLGNSLHFVLEALRQPVGSKFFKFGSIALVQFQNRLSEWPRYCALLLQIPHLHQAIPEIVQFMKNLESRPAANDNIGEGRPEIPASKDLTDRESVAKPTEAPVFTALKIDTLLEAADKDSLEIPNEATQDKILFIINNVSPDNLSAKVAEMQEILKEQHYRWFSHYLVVKRVSIEPNFHDLYISFLDGLKSRNLDRNVLHETYLNIEILLNSEKTVTSSSERSLLKNLGTWLGGITLSKNKPIKHKNLAFKELLLEGYDSDRLIVVIPFVCKVLEQCHASIVFKPPNPWLMAIMKLLAELYYFAELKLNLKFEVEVLCKKIQLDINSMWNDIKHNIGHWLILSSV
jgi:CCR4-NOT transcription complex subunit 1